jgi:hypothetical protein
MMLADLGAEVIKIQDTNLSPSGASGPDDQELVLVATARNNAVSNNPSGSVPPNGDIVEPFRT